MTVRRYVTVASLWVVSLVVVAVVASAQVARPQMPVREPKIISGADLGFRVTSMGERPAGQLMIRVNGEWLEVEFGGVLLR